MVGHLIPDIQPQFGNDGELVPPVGADVGTRRKDALSECPDLRDLIRVVDRLPAGDCNGLPCVTDRQFDQRVEGPVTSRSSVQEA